ncbi:MAG: DUF421 domain-containing protein [Solirubrobacterales bacterium]
MTDFIIRAVGMYIAALIVIRIMGKRALGELGLFDFVVMTGVGHILTSVALDQSLPFYDGLAVLVVLAGMEYLVGYFSLKNQHFSHLVSGRPVIMIDNGRVIRDNLAREKFNVDDLLQELRKQGIRDIGEVEKGILEPSGGFSVILKADAEPVTRGELGIEWEPEPRSILTYCAESREDVFSPKVYPPRQPGTLVDLPDRLRKLEHDVEAILKAIERLSPPEQKP